MTARVRVAGEYLDRLAPVGDLVDSTVFRADGFSGDYQSSCTWAVLSGFSASWFRRGALYEVVERGGRTWGGILAEPEMTDEGIELHADGFGAMGSDWPAIVDSGGGVLVPSTVTDDVLDYAFSTGCPVDRNGATFSPFALGGEDGAVGTVASLLTRLAPLASNGSRWWVDSYGVLTFAVEPTVPTHTLVPGAPRLGMADESYASHLYGYYVVSVDADGQPNAWALVVAGDGEMAAQYGRKSVVVDLTARGVLSAPDAQADIDGRFAQVGGRMGFTSSIDLTASNLRRLGAGWASPMSVRAGDRLRIPGVTDRTQPSYRASLEVTLGEVTRVHAELRAVATPIGYVARDFEGAIAAAQAPPTTV